MTFVVDRFVGEYAVLIDDKMNPVVVPRLVVENTAREGSYLFFNGVGYEIDQNREEEKRRIKSKFDRLKKM